jgi:hypothetical protein
VVSKGLLVRIEAIAGTEAVAIEMIVAVTETVAVTEKNRVAMIIVAEAKEQVRKRGDSFHAFNTRETLGQVFLSI